MWLLNLLHVHWFRFQWSSYSHVYEDCRCSKRRARTRRGTSGPIALWWLNGLEGPVSKKGDPRG